jgi:competence ComEA-like helix-hairpin-helix protein
LRIDRRTFNGGTILLALNLLFAIAFFVQERWLEEKKPIQPEPIELDIPERTSDTGGYEPDTLFAFDPNELSMEGWKRLGLSEEEASVILNYRRSGARFYEAEDLLRVYSIGREEVRAWRDSLKFPGSQDETGQADDGVTEGRERSPEEKKEGKGPKLFPFDPNRLSQKGWTRLGLTPDQASVVMRYRNAGGKFWQASGLLDLYVVDSSLYRKWKPYVRIDREALKVAIDRAGAKALRRLPGIGEGRAGRILEYRELLGGFHRKEQLDEVYGIPDSLMATLMARVKVSGGMLDPIPIDTTAERLMQHPYIDPATADAIEAHRERYGPFEEKSELRALDLMSAEEYRKIAPYLELPSHGQ